MPRQESDIRLGTLDVSVSDHDAPPGTLRLLREMTWRGSREAPMISPAEQPQALTDRLDASETLGALPSGVRAMHVQVRQRLGAFADLAGDPEQSLLRYVLVTDDQIYLVDPGQGYAIKSIYTFPDALAFSKKAQFTQQADITYIAISVGQGAGDPAPMLVLIDDVILDYNLPDVPYCSFSVLGAGDFDEGTYAVRFAWLMKDDTLAKPTRPYFITVGAGDQLRFTIGSYKVALTADQERLFAGVQVLLTQKADSANELRDELMNLPYWQVALIGSTATGSSVDLSDTNDNLVGYPLFVDENLLGHRLGAGAVFSFNRRLLAGDVAVDFAQPDVLANLVGGTVGQSANNPPTWTASDGNPSLVICSAGEVIYFTTEDPDLDDIAEVRIVDRFPLPLSLFQWEAWDGAAWIYAGSGEINLSAGFAKKRLRFTVPACSFLLDDSSTFGPAGKTYDLVLRSYDTEGELSQVGFQIAVIA